MKGKKLKNRKLMMYGIALLIAALNVSIYSGNAEKQRVVIVKGEIDTTKSLDEQLEQFTTVEMKKNDASKLGNSVVKDLSELSDKRISVALTEGSPIPKALLLEGKGFGQFASSTKEYQTVYNIVGGAAQLPKGVKAGDKIDISIMTISSDGKKLQRLDVLMKNVEIYSLTETDVYVKVSQSAFGELTVAKTLGDFVLQLPGQKDVPRCETLTEEDKLKKECYSDDDKPSSVKAEDIINKIQDGKVINQSEVDKVEKLKAANSTNEELTTNNTSESGSEASTDKQQSGEVENRQGIDEKINDFNEQ